MPARRAWMSMLHSPRWASLLGIMLLTVPVTQGSLGPRPAPVDPVRPLAVGFTFSQRQAEYLMLPWAKVYAATLGLSPAVIRLGAYWDRIERTPGSYDFSVLDLQLDRAGARGMDVILTVGMKAPRWPEYYLPRWLEERVVVGHGGDVSEDPEVRARVLAFVDRVVRHVRTHRAIVVWQVENEPLDPSGPNRWTIGEKLLAEEVALVRRLDDRPIIVSTFVDVDPLMNAPWRRAELRRRAEVILDLADILGLDLYPNRGLQLRGHDLYFHWPVWIWEPAMLELRELALARGQSVWIMEAQAEPWEPNRLVYTDVPFSRSVQPQRAVAAVERLTAAGYDTILLWGVEHWYMRRERHRRTDWWNAMSTFFEAELAAAEIDALASDKATGGPPPVQRGPQAGP